jgi:signal recognition particle GTPase
VCHPLNINIEFCKLLFQINVRLFSYWYQNIMSDPAVAAPAEGQQDQAVPEKCAINLIVVGMAGSGKTTFMQVSEMLSHKTSGSH